MPDALPELTEFNLTKTEMRVLTLIADGLGMQEIADALGISYRSVTSHTASLTKKFGTPNRIKWLQSFGRWYAFGAFCPVTDSPAVPWGLCTACDRLCHLRAATGYWTVPMCPACLPRLGTVRAESHGKAEGKRKSQEKEAQEKEAQEKEAQEKEAQAAERETLARRSL